jgi:hypothetical protein
MQFVLFQFYFNFDSNIFRKEAIDYSIIRESRLNNQRFMFIQKQYLNWSHKKSVKF